MAMYGAKVGDYVIVGYTESPTEGSISGCRTAVACCEDRVCREMVGKV